MTIMKLSAQDGTELSDWESQHECLMILDAGSSDLCDLIDSPDDLPKRVADACGLVQSACEGLGEPTDWLVEMQTQLLQVTSEASAAARGAAIRDILDRYEIGRSDFDVVATISLRRPN